MTTELRIGIPSKGRLADQATSLLNQAGLSFRRQNRSLFAKVSGLPVEVTFLRTDDIPILCAEGAIDMGITGGDLVNESQADVRERLALGVGKCRLAVCVPEGSSADIAQLDGKRIATSFPNITRDFLAQHGATAHLVSISGSVEVMIQLGVADAIVDIVETGSTLAANKLEILTEIAHYETVLVQRKDFGESELVDRVVRRLEGVIIARSYSLLEYNISRENLAAAETLTPGFDSPTISALENKDMCAVRVMVKNKQIIQTMEKLEAIGATAILQVPIQNCRL